MYQRLKQITKSIIPTRMLYKFEPVLRSILYLKYKGTNYTCNICNKPLKQFIELDDNDLLCPNCGSLARNRLLFQVLSEKYLKPGIKMLDFSPSRCLYRTWKRNENIEYVGTDLSGDFLADKQYDITQIDCNDNTFDFIVCYHILEHIKDDRLAMNELKRILKSSGTCLIQTPFKTGSIYENEKIKTPEDRLKHFGQEDHVRIYSVEGLKKRLEESGFLVEILNFKNASDNFHGLNSEETILVCTIK
jgi:SAM-dependent methyltransferase